MQHSIIRSLAISAVLMCLIGIGSSQLTLSKGWGPGKRSFYEDNCTYRTKSVIAYWLTFESELRRLISCEKQRMAYYEQPTGGTRMKNILFMNSR